uniref:SUI1 domain-containing protein n=1 Tax=Gadus morhua TaxID=8049 RepID=A0A8C4ZZM9_GADMO
MVGLNLKIPYHYLLKPEASLGMSCLNQLRSHYMSKPPSVSLSWTDPFADATKGDDLVPSGTEDKIHIRIQQRNGRKTLTTVQGIGIDYDKKKLVKAFKKKFACNGTVIEHPEYGEVIQLQGDQRKNICTFLMEIGIVREDQLKVHGF